MRRSVILFIALAPLTAQAAPKDELAKTQAALKESQANQAKLGKQQASVEKELAALQEKLVKSAASLQKSDAALEAAQRKLQSLETELVEKEKTLAIKRQKMDGLSRIAIRLSRTPPQAMVLMPTDGKNRIQASRALALITAEIKRQAETIGNEMEALHALKVKVEEDKTEAEKIRNANREEKKSFEAALKTRKQLRDKLAASKAQEDKKIAELAKKARNLQELVNALSAEAAKPPTRGDRDVVSEEGISGNKGRMRDFEDSKGRIRLPVSGKVVMDYGQRDGGDTSKGIKIAARSGATVVAPFDAEVAYSGTFLNYGRLVILKHRGNYHTLLAGLSRIDVKSGDFLLEGEPIGAMDNANDQQLYVELRQNNQPINPEKWMRGL